MEKPVTWKMIERHRVYGSMSPGEEVFLEVEQMLNLISMPLWSISPLRLLA